MMPFWPLRFSACGEHVRNMLHRHAKGLDVGADPAGSVRAEHADGVLEACVW
jgi:hypothetical protein